ncbi:Conserved_hypothetical protein [Hexamita inflata]|uniref:Uncharacterized protein n=1 Tax=Hexamita inflata TaxID=28002 RepID=A0AA86UX90_9EUKA|nr:Conserved hypothetical protein [Hexamita inflata]
MQAQNVYDDAMTVKYMDKVIDGVLKIQNDPELTSLDFLQTEGEIFNNNDLGLNIVDFEQSFGLAITKLELENCCNIIPKLTNRNIKELIINNCNVSNIDLLQLDGLVELCLQCSQGCICNSKLMYNMTKFNMLTQLSLNGYNGVDISPLSQMIQLNVLSLKSCGLIFVDSLKYLVNLKELYLSHNKNLDITPLQYIPQITKLDLSSCSLKSIEVLKVLVNLLDLSLQDNQIIYISPLEQLNQLHILNAEFNTIIDLQTLQNHPNFQQYQLSLQEQPSEKQIQYAKDNMNYDQQMTEQYVDKIKNGELNIDLESLFQGYVNKQLYGLQFLQNLNIQTLFLNSFNARTLLMYNCENIIPKIHSNTITKLVLSDVHLKNWNLDNLQLENLEQLFLKKEILYDYGGHQSDEKQIKTLEKLYGEDCCDNPADQLEQSIVKFKKLNELCIDVEVNVNIAMISQMTQLEVLTLNCRLSNVDALKYLINLKQLCICSNINMESIPIQHLTQLVVLRLKCQKINIDITSLQYLHQLIILNLSSCGLIFVDSLKYLVNLKELYLSHNKNLDITPLQYIPQITKLDLSSCSLKSIEVLKVLVNLLDLSLQDNQIIYISPLEQLNQLHILNAEFNTIIDLQTLQNHPNFQQYQLSFQQQPSEKQIQYAKDNMNYDQQMTEQYVDKIKNGELNIDLESLFQGYVNKQLYGLQFLQNLNIQTLFLNSFNARTLLMYNCENIIPKIHSNTITKLVLSDVHLKNWNLDNLQLENLEQLFLKKEILYDYGGHQSDEKQIKTLEKLYGEDCCDNPADQLEQSIVKFKKLNELCIDVEVNVNIAMISQMTQLEVLTLNCRLSNVDALKYLINLKQLCICSNINMESIPIQHLTQLVVLRLKCQKINVDSLKLLQNLKELDLSGNKNIDITPLQYIPQITKLDLSSCGLIFVDFLEYLINLKELDLSGNQNLDITPLQYVPQITKLDLSSCSLKSIEVLKAPVNLKYLSLKSNQIVFIQPLQKLNQLQKRNFYGNRLIDLSNNVLSLKSCGLIFVDSLKYLINLKELDLSRNKNIDITPLQYIPQITKLDLSSCELKSIEVLKLLVNLLDLSLQDNQIIYISPLEKLNQLQKLNVQGNRLIDLYTIKNHPNFKECKLNDQEKPSKFEIRYANYLKKICIPIDSLKMLKQKKNLIIQAKQKVEDLLKKLLCQQVAFVGQVAVLFQQLNAFDNYL